MKLTKVIIDSVTVKDSSSAGDPKQIFKWEITKEEKAIGYAEVTAPKTIIDTVAVSTGQIIEILGGNTTSTDQRFFYGRVTSIKPEGSQYILTCSNEMIDLVRKNVNKVYDSTIDASAGEVSEIAKDLIETYGGMTAVVQASGTADGEKVTEFKCINTDIYERLMALKKALNWDLYYNDATRIVHFEPLGYIASGKTLTVKEEILGLPDWDIDTSEMINDLRVDGATIETTLTETGRIGTTSGYTTSSILLTKTPNSAELLIDSSDPPTTQREGGSKDASASGYYYIDRENKKIIPATGTTFTTNDYAIINYIWSSPAPIHMKNQASIDLYGSFQKAIELSDITSVADAESRATNILSKRSSPFITGTMKVKLTDVPNRGESVNIVDSITPAVSGSSLSGTYVTTAVKYFFPSGFEEIVVGDRPFRIADWQQNTEERLKRLEEQFVRNQDILLELQEIALESTTQPRYSKIGTTNIAGDTMIWGSDIFGIWGTAKWGSTANISFVLGNPSAAILGTSELGSKASAEVDHFIMQFENEYTEDFIDDDFEGAGTASWSTTGSVTFTSGQIALSSSIDYNNSTITTATLDSTEVSGDFDYRLTADGTTFEQIARPFVHYKMNDDAASTVVVDSMGFLNGTLAGGDNTEDLATTGKIGGALDFNGTDDYVQCNIGNPTNLTYMCWFNALISEQDFNNPSADLVQLMWTQDDNPSIGFRSSGVVRASIKNGSEAGIGATTTTAINDGAWNHVALTFDGTNLKIYLNGVLDATSSTVVGRGSHTNVTRLMRDDAGRFVEGKQDDVRFYNFALSAADILNVYNAGTGTESISFPHTFTATGTDLRFKITENASTTGEISQVTITDYH